MQDFSKNPNGSPEREKGLKRWVSGAKIWPEKGGSWGQHVPAPPSNVKSLTSTKFELATINPGYVVGPVLHGSSCTSMILVQRILTRDPPANLRLQLPVVDVRDVAKAHVSAMTEPGAAGIVIVIVMIPLQPCETYRPEYRLTWILTQQACVTVPGICWGVPASMPAHIRSICLHLKQSGCTLGPRLVERSNLFSFCVTCNLAQDFCSNLQMLSKSSAECSKVASAFWQIFRRNIFLSFY